jgi:hypothetical protein
MQARALFQDGTELLKSGAQADGIDRLRTAHDLDRANTKIRAALLDALAQEASRSLDGDWKKSEALIQEALELDPGHPLSKSVRTLIEDRKRAEYVTECLSQARESQVAGDLLLATQIVDRALSIYPKEPRLVDFRQALLKHQQSRPEAVQPELVSEGSGEIPPPGPSRGRKEKRDGVNERAAALGRAIAGGFVWIRSLPSKIRPAPVVDRRGQGRPLDKRALGAGLAATLVAIGFGAGVTSWVGERSRKAEPQPAQFPVSIQVAPAGASVRLVPSGRPNDATEGIPTSLLEGEYAVTATLDGYEPGTGTLRVGPGREGVLNLVLQPVSQLLRLTTDAEDASITLNDQPLSASAPGQFLLEDLATGSHTLKFTGKFGTQATVLFETRPGQGPEITGPIQARNLKIVLIRAANGKAHVSTNYGPLEVSLDDQPRGPLGEDGIEMDGLSAGLHKLTLRNEQKENQDLQFEVGPSPALFVNLGSDRNVGSLVIDAGAEGAVVLIDGRKQNPFRQGGKLVVNNLIARERVVRVERDGYYPHEERVTIRKGQQLELKVALKAVPSDGRLTVRNMPSDMTLAIADGGSYMPGEGGQLMISVKPGTRVLRFSRPGYRVVETKREFSAGDQVEIDASALNFTQMPGRLTVTVTPSSAKVSIIRRDRDRTRIPYQGPNMELPEGLYEVEAQNPGYITTGRNITVEAGQPLPVEIQLARIEEKAPPEPVNPMSLWTNAKDWKQEGEWSVLKSGVARFELRPKGAVFSFQIRCEGGSFLGIGGCTPRLLLDYQDSRNYVEYLIEKNKLKRRQLVNGVGGQNEEQRHNARAGEAYPVRITVRDLEIRFEMLEGGSWRTVDRIISQQGVFTDGRFVIDARNEVGLRNFDVKP